MGWQDRWKTRFDVTATGFGNEHRVDFSYIPDELGQAEEWLCPHPPLPQPRTT